MSGTRASTDYARHPLLVFWVAVVLLFLYVPMVALVAGSFNASRRGGPWGGFTFEWYARFFQDGPLLEAFGNSLAIAAISTLASLALGALAGLALWRFRSRGNALLAVSLSLPIVVPEICLGVAMMVLFSKIIVFPPMLGWPLGLVPVIIAHISFSFPFVAVVVRSRLGSFNPELEDAARDLGAGPLRILWDIYLPHLKPALVAGGLMAFTLSLDDFVITFFTAGPNTVTFPVKVYSMLRFSVSPEVNAASTVLMIVIIFLTILGARLQGRALGKI